MATAVHVNLTAPPSLAETPPYPNQLCDSGRTKTRTWPATEGTDPDPHNPGLDVMRKGEP